MKLLLVGGAGHVGQLITPYLKARHTLRVLDLAPPADPEIEHVKGSVLDPEAIRSSLVGVDGFIWLAMRSAQGGMVTDQDIETIINNYDLNTKALHLFLYLAQEAGVKRGVYTSSMSVHYRGRPNYPGEDQVPRLALRLRPQQGAWRGDLRLFRPLVRHGYHRAEDQRAAQAFRLSGATAQPAAGRRWQLCLPARRRGHGERLSRRH